MAFTAPPSATAWVNTRKSEVAAMSDTSQSSMPKRVSGLSVPYLAMASA
jgi:hypothetical protein